MTKTFQLSDNLPIGRGDPLSGTPYAPGTKNCLNFMFRLFMLLLVMGQAQAGWSQVVIGGWDTSTLPGGSNDFGPSPYAATETAANVTVGGFTRGSGISTTGTAAARGWGGTSWGTSFNNGDSSVLFNDFFTFTVKANAGYTLSLSSIGPFDYRRSATGPLFAEIQYQINAGAYSLITTVSLPSTSTSGASVGSTDLSGIPALQNLPSSSTVTFRIVPFRATSTAGTFYIFDTGASAANDFAVNGTICALPSCSISGPDLDLVCNNTSGIIYSAPAGMDSYNWSISAGGSIPGSTTGQSVSVTSGNFLSDYTVYLTITDGNGCASSCSKQGFIYLLKPPADITINPNPACFGATLDLSIAAASSSTVSWSGEGITNSNGTFVPDGFGGFYNQTTAIPTTTGPHIYNVTVNAANTCSNTGTATVTVNPAPPACSVTGPTTVCANSTGNVYSAPGGVSGYSWGVSGSGSIVGSTTGSSVTVTAGAGATYTVSVTLTDANGCTSTCSQPVTINPLPTGSITGPPFSTNPISDTLCTTYQYVFTGPPGMSAHNWGVSANGAIDGSATGSSVMITVNSGLFLHVRDTITDANGCRNVLIYSRPVQQSPTCSLNGPPTVCGGSTGNVYTVTTNAQFYSWSISGNATITSATNGTSVTVTAGASGTYTVTVATQFSFNTCVKICSQTVTIEGCCEFVASCPANTDLGAYNCNTLGNIPAMPATLAQIQAAPYNITLGADPCGQIKFTASDNATPNICSATNQTITRTIVVWDDLSPFNNIKDSSEASTTCTYTYVVQADKTNPQFTSCPAAAIDLGCNPALPDAGKAKNDAGPATDNCGTPAKSAVGGAITGACVKTQTWVVTATDGCNNTATCTVVYTWKSDTQKPDILDKPDYTLPGCNPAWPALTTTWTDNCAGSGSITATAGTVQTSGCTQTRVYTFTKTDGCGNTDVETTTVTRTYDVTRPVFVSGVPANITVQCNAVPLPANPVATDNCGSVTVVNNPDVRTNGACPDSYTLTRKWTANDACGNTRTVTQRITVVDNTKPTFTFVPQNLTIECEGCCGPNIPVGIPTAIDNCDTDVTITYLGEVGVYFNCPANRQLQRTWRATDNCGNSTTAMQTIDIRDTRPPVFTSVPAHTTIECSDLVPQVGQATATDACGGYVQVAFLGNTSSAGDCPQEYTLLRTWRATDECGNSVTVTQTITVQDTQAPVFNNAPADVAVICGMVPAAPIVTAADNCDNYVPVTYLGESNNGPDCPYTIMRTWTVVDDCGNPRTHTQTITVGPLPVGGLNEPQAHLPEQAEVRGSGAMAHTLTALLAPNPALEEVWVSFDSDLEGEATLRMFDLNGRMAVQQSFTAYKGPNRYRVDLGGMTGGGMYMVHLLVGDRQAVERLVVLQK